MRDFFLTEGEIKQITGCSSAEDQVQALRSLGIPFFQPRRAKPKVVRDVLVQVQVSRAMQPKAQGTVPVGMNLAALNG